MKIRPNLSATFFDGGFNGSTDPFQLSDLAARMTHLFRSLQHGSVAILDGRWGTGKTVFAKQWVGELKRQGIPAIYFDAFAADYIEQPFQAISAAFLKAASDAQKNNSPTYERFLSAAAKTSKKIASTAAKIGTKVVTLGVIGSAEIDQLSAVKDDIADAVAGSSETAVKRLLEDQANSEASFEALRKSLSELPSLLSEDLPALDYPEEQRPLIVIIDELDRCRPDFALGILETLKHFFRVDGIHFVLVTNRAHLLFSVQKRYGVGDSAEEYIQKFYDFIIHFEQLQEQHRGTAGKIYAKQLVSALIPLQVPSSERVDLDNYLQEIAFALNLTLRQVESVVTNVVMSYASVRERELRPPLIICFLAAIKMLRPDLFFKAKLGTLTYSDFVSVFQDARWSGNLNVVAIMQLFQYHLDPEIDLNSEEFKHYGSSTIRHGVERLRMIPYVANAVLDRFGKV